MRTIESRRFVAGGQELRLFLVEEKGHRLPFRVRLKHATKNGVVAGFATEAEAVAALDVQGEKAVAAGWTQVPGQVRLALEIPAAPGSATAPGPPACAHKAIQVWLQKLAPGKSAVCPDCGENVKP
jgi:hypothetical protein